MGKFIEHLKKIKIMFDDFRNYKDFKKFWSKLDKSKINNEELIFFIDNYVFELYSLAAPRTVLKSSHSIRRRINNRFNIADQICSKLTCCWSSTEAMTGETCCNS